MLSGKLAVRNTRLMVSRCARASFSCSSVARSSSASHPPYGPVGVARALAGSLPTGTDVEPTLFKKEFSLADRVGLVTGGNRGIGLETALALLEAGARAVYCLDLPREPGEEWTKVREYAARMPGRGRLEYISGDVRDQEAIWKTGECIGDREGRMDVCIAGAGIFTGSTPSLDYSTEEFQNVVDVNLKGALFTAQAAGRQMLRFGHGGSIIVIASICGSLALEPTICSVSYHSTKSALLQMSRSMACELATKNIRVNTISPGFISTNLTRMMQEDPELFATCLSDIPIGRFGRPDELRGVVAWLASDASSFCTGSDIVVSGGHHAW